MIVGAENVDIEEDVPENEGAPAEGEEDEGKKGKAKEEIEEEKPEEAAPVREKLDISKVIVLTDETKGNYTLHDIVVPLVGRDIPYKINQLTS